MKNLLYILILLLFVSCSEDELPCYVYDSNEVLVTDEVDMLEMVNQARTVSVEYTDIIKGDTVGVFKYTDWLDLPELTLDSTLIKTAQIQCEYMYQTDNMSHYWCDGTGIVERLKWGNYTGQRYGENIAFGQCSSDAQIFQLWLDSKPHRENILSDRFNIVGIAKKGIYFTMVFGYKQ